MDDAIDDANYALKPRYVGLNAILHANAHVIYHSYEYATAILTTCVSYPTADFSEQGEQRKEITKTEKSFIQKLTPYI